MEFLASCKGKRVLEIGCGIGKDARFLLENGVDYWGIDFSQRTLALAAQHLSFRGLSNRLVCADAAALPFADASFDLVMAIGVLHHVPNMSRACQEAARVLRPGGTLRVMLYNRRSYHYFLVRGVVCPMLWILRKVPLPTLLLRPAPKKFRDLLDIVRKHGYSSTRVLAASADTSVAGADNFTPVSGFYTEAEMRALFPGFEEHRFFRRELKYFPLPFLRKHLETRWGFFLTMTARKLCP